MPQPPIASALLSYVAATDQWEENAGIREWVIRQVCGWGNDAPTAGRGPL